MKTAAMTLALTLGLSALNTMAQDENERSRRGKETPRGGELLMEREGRQAQRPPAKDADRGRPGDVRSRQRPQGGPGGLPERMGRVGRGFGPPGMAPGRGQGGDDVASTRRGFGPQGRFGQGGPGVGAGGRGQGFGPPWLSRGRGSFQRPDGVCPGCGRPYGPLGQQGNLRGGGPGFGPRALAPGFEQQGRGSGFGPPPWAGRGSPRSQMRSDPRGPRSDAPPMYPNRGFGPTRRGPGGSGGPEGRLERGSPGPRPESPGPADRPPMERDER